MKTINQTINQYLDYLKVEKNNSPATVKTYGFFLNKFSDYIKESYPNLNNLSDLTIDHVKTYRYTLKQKTATQNLALIVLRVFFKFLRKNNLADINYEQIELAKTEERQVRFLTTEQVNKLLNTPDSRTKKGKRDRAILEVLFDTGLRVSELLSLTLPQINFDRKEITVIGKGSKRRVVFISDQAVKYLNKYLETYPIKDKIFSITSKTVQNIVKIYCHRAMLSKIITPHGLRHSLATNLLSSGADLRSIQEILGHKNIATTQIYTHVTNEQLSQTYKKFHIR